MKPSEAIKLKVELKTLKCSDEKLQPTFELLLLECILEYLDNLYERGLLGK